MGTLDAAQEFFNPLAKEGGYYDKCGLDWLVEYVQYYRKGWNQMSIEIAITRAERKVH